MSARLLAVHHGGGIGGAPISLLKLLAALDPNEFAPRAVFTEPGAAPAYGAELGVPSEVVSTGGAFFYSAHARLGPRSLASFVRSFPSAVQLARKTLRRLRPDLVNLNTSVLLAWAAAARRERVPVVWTVREVLGPNPWLRHWHASFILHHARRVVAISHAVAACFPPPVECVYNAVDLDEFRIDVEPADLAVPDGSKILVMVGAVQKPKGHWLMLEALAHLPDDVELVLVTGGVDAAYGRSVKGRIKRLARVPLDNLDAFLRDARRMGLTNRIHVTGFRRDVAPVIAATDVLVFPSLEPEGFGRPLIEAMALQRPIVAADIGPSRELIGPDAGLLVTPEPVQLAQAIQQLLSAPETRERMGRAGRVRVEACFSLERQVAEMSSIYRETLAIT